MLTLYSEQAAGQQKFGGWSAKGRKRLEGLTKTISDALQKTRGKEAEKVCLETLKIKHNIGKKGGKKKVAVVLAEGEDPCCDGAIAWGQESDDDATVGEDSDVEEVEEEEEEDQLAQGQEAQGQEVQREDQQGDEEQDEEQQGDEEQGQEA